MPQARGVRGGRRSARNDAAAQRRLRSGSLPDIVIVLAFTAVTMAVVFFVASFTSERVAAGEAGPTLARLFAGSLVAVALVTFLLGAMLFRENAYLGLRLTYAAILGAVIGVFESLLFLQGAGLLLGLPPVFALLAIRPVREWFLGGIGLLPRKGRRQ
jgi:hypothetical protein